MLERILHWLIVAAACGTVATCGQKGPLELPDEQAASTVRNPGTVDHNAPTSARGRLYEKVPRHRVPVTWGEADGLRA